MASLSAELAYLFRHAMLRDAAYQLQPPTARAHLHRCALEILEEVLPEAERDAAAGELADHARGAGPIDPEGMGKREVDYLMRAAQGEERGFRPGAAFALYTQISTHPHAMPARRLRAYHRAAGALLDLGRTDEASESLGHAEACLDANSQPAEHFALLADRGRLAFLRGEHESALQQLGAAVAQAQAHGPSTFLANALTNMGSALDLMGRLDDAEAAYLRAIDVSVAVGDIAAQARDRGNLGTIYARKGDMDAARRSFELAVEFHAAAGNARFEGIVSGNMAMLSAMTGDAGAAHRWQSRALSCIRRAGDKASEGYMLGNYADLLLQVGRITAALQAMHKGMALLRESGTGNAEAVLRRTCGCLLLLLGRREEAEAELAQIEMLVARADAAFRVRAQLQLRVQLALSEPARDVAAARRLVAEAGETLTAAGVHAQSESMVELQRARDRLQQVEHRIAAGGEWPAFHGEIPARIAPACRQALLEYMQENAPAEYEASSRDHSSLLKVMREGTEALPEPDWRGTLTEE